ncbi:hypothetical protein CYMTET_28271 [Cymbomonas tetramitiformis]|uniref:Transcription initiation factor TFIID subunit 9 n=1 Tax=Cymbomonas tetramitiformis TaxID=36881 RepID=A0AAE0FNB2_9CHLO|nr:hypothetical protein CYMTET_28271 [Cymbomonas tetramitiformis]
MASAGESSEVPRDIKVIENILRSMGVQQWEPRVLNQLLEYMYRYVSEVLEESQAYSEYAGKSSIDVQDVRLAERAYVNSTFTSPPPREVLQQLSHTLNAVPLKPISGRPGMHLPPEEQTLTTPGWQVLLPTPAAAAGVAGAAGAAGAGGDTNMDCGTAEAEAGAQTRPAQGAPSADSAASQKLVTTGGKEVAAGRERGQKLAYCPYSDRIRYRPAQPRDCGNTDATALRYVLRQDF